MTKLDLNDYLDCPEKLQTACDKQVNEIFKSRAIETDFNFIVVFDNAKASLFNAYGKSSAGIYSLKPKPKTKKTFYRAVVYSKSSGSITLAGRFASSKHEFRKRWEDDRYVILEDTWEEREFEIND